MDLDIEEEGNSNYKKNLKNDEFRTGEAINFKVHKVKIK